MSHELGFFYSCLFINQLFFYIQLISTFETAEKLISKIDIKLNIEDKKNMAYQTNKSKYKKAKYFGLMSNCSGSMVQFKYIIS